jgi:group I intron endonuclease
VENIKKLIIIVAKALPSFNKQFSTIFVPRISAIIFIYSGALAFNALYIQSIGSRIGIYSGLFKKKIKAAPQRSERLILLISLFILIRVYVIGIFVNIYLLSFVFIKALKGLWFFRAIKHFTKIYLLPIRNLFRDVVRYLLGVGGYGRVYPLIKNLILNMIRLLGKNLWIEKLINLDIIKLKNIANWLRVNHIYLWIIITGFLFIACFLKLCGLWVSYFIFGLTFYLLVKAVLNLYNKMIDLEKQIKNKRLEENKEWVYRSFLNSLALENMISVFRSYFIHGLCGPLAMLFIIIIKYQLNILVVSALIFIIINILIVITSDFFIEAVIITMKNIHEEWLYFINQLNYLLYEFIIDKIKGTEKSNVINKNINTKNKNSSIIKTSNLACFRFRFRFLENKSVSGRGQKNNAIKHKKCLNFNGGLGNLNRKVIVNNGNGLIFNRFASTTCTNLDNLNPNNEVKALENNSPSPSPVHPLSHPIKGVEGKGRTDWTDATGAIASYTNLHLPEIVNEIRYKYKGKGIVYGIQNNINKKLYIGSSADGFKRIYGHLVRPKHDHSNLRLRNSIVKHGLKNFTLYIFNVIEFADSLTTEKKKGLLIPVEQVHINNYLPLKRDQLFNFLYEAGSTLGYSHTEATKVKISAGIRKSASNQKKRAISELAKTKFVERLKLFNEKKKIKIYVYDSNLILINDKPFSSKAEAILFLKISPATITKYIDKNIPYVKNNTYLYFSSKLLTEEEKLRCYETKLLDNQVVNETIPLSFRSQKKNTSKKVWVYTKSISGELVPYNNDEPTFKSIRLAAKALNCGTSTIVIKLLAGKNQIPVRGLYFYNEKQVI